MSFSQFCRLVYTRMSLVSITQQPRQFLLFVPFMRFYKSRLYYINGFCRKLDVLVIMRSLHTIRQIHHYILSYVAFLRFLYVNLNGTLIVLLFFHFVQYCIYLHTFANLPISDLCINFSQVFSNLLVVSYFLPLRTSVAADATFEVWDICKL